jgi:hypothetical protein
LKTRFIKTNLILNARQDTAGKMNMMIMMTRGVTIPQTTDLASKNMKRILEKAMQQTLFKTI